MSLFKFREFNIRQTHAALKVGTDALVFGSLISVKGKSNLLDIGTGTGVLSLMLAQRNRELKVTGLEIHLGSIQDAEYNFQASGFKNEMKVIPIDFQSFVSDEKFDLIVSNPPFYSEALLGKNEELNKAKHVTDLTLDVLISKTSKLLSNSGSFWIIWPYSEKETLIQLAHNVQLFPNTLYLVNGKTNLPLRTIIEFSSTENQEVQELDFTIRDEKGNYTEEYKKLTQIYHDRVL